MPEYKFLASANIDVFPSGFRGESYGISKLTTEQNLTQTRLFSAYAKNNNFIIKHPNDTNKLILGIYGYIFILDINVLESLIYSIPENGRSNLYACINLRQLDSNYGNVLGVLGSSSDSILDVDDVFKGLGFANSDIEGISDSLKIKITDDSGVITYSNLKLSSDEIRDYASDKPISDTFTTKDFISDTVKCDNINNVKIDGSSSNHLLKTIKFNGSLSLPGNAPFINALLQQESIGFPSWISYSEDSLPSTIVKRDSLGDILCNRVNGVYIYLSDTGNVVLKNNSLSDKYHLLIESNGANNGCLKVTSEGQIYAKASNTTDDNAKIKLSGNVQVLGNLAISTDVNVTVKKDLYAYSGLTVGESDSQTGPVTIKSYGFQPTTIIGPNNGTIRLPDNHSGGYDAVLTQNNAIPKWTQVSSTNITGTVVSRNASGISEFNNIKVTNSKVKNKKFIYTDTDGSLAGKDSISVNDISDIKNVAKTGSYNSLTDTPTIATPEKEGLGKTGYIENGKNYAVKVDANSKMYVNVPWVDTNTTYSAANPSTLGLVKTGYSNNGKNYAVNLDSNSKMYVNVPWTDNNTTYSISSPDQGSVKLTPSSGNSSTITLSNLGKSGSPTFTKVTAGSFVSTSDLRLKTNIKDYVSKKSILDLPIKSFDYISGEKNQIGCIAQDLQEICPELVEENSEGYLTIKESKLIYLLINEVKQLKSEINELKNKVK